MIKHLWQKEIQAELYTWKGMLWLVIAAVLFSFTSYLLLTNSELSLLDQTELMWLFGKVVIAAALLVVTIDASILITNEFEHETLESLFLAPVTLPMFVLGKILSSLTLWAAVLVVATPYIIVISAGTHLAPAFIGYVALLGTLGVLGFTFLIFGISLFFRSVRNSITTGLVILFVFAIPALFATNLKNGIVAQVFGRANPIDNIFSALDNILVDYKTALLSNWQFVLPLLLFCVVTFLILIFSMSRFEKHGIIRTE
jgi:ABC-type transport system involved in multi-copper enzyme maturation permease subunit